MVSGFPGWSRARRILLMLSCTLGSLSAIIAAFFFLESQGWAAGDGVLTTGGVAAVAGFGVVFLYLQMLAVSAALSLALQRETGHTQPTSDPQGE